MKLICVEDDKQKREEFEKAVHQRLKNHTLNCFSKGSDALAYVQTHPVDVAVLTETLPDISGIALAKKLTSIHENLVTIFLADQKDFARDAFRAGGIAYLERPFSPEDLNRTFALLSRIDTTAEQKPTHTGIFIKTFGRFDLLIDGNPVIFQTAKAKELLAILVDAKGGIFTNMEIFHYLWGNKVYNKVTSTYVRKVIKSLKVQLEEAGCLDLISSHRNSLSINMTAFREGYFDCDYLNLLSNNTKYLQEYNGQYMLQYFWAKESFSSIENKINYLLHS